MQLDYDRNILQAKGIYDLEHIPYLQDGIETNISIQIEELLPDYNFNTKMLRNVCAIIFEDELSQEQIDGVDDIVDTIRNYFTNTY